MRWESELIPVKSLGECFRLDSSAPDALIVRWESGGSEAASIVTSGEESAGNLASPAAPRMFLSWPVERKTPVPVVLICPGGGYSDLAMSHEGHDLARWLNGLGFAAAVLEYRLPRVDLEKPPIPWPIQDGMRALIWLREHAKSWGIDRSRMGILGSSAGGHLASCLATNSYQAILDSSEGSTRVSWLDFQILLYPRTVYDDETGARAFSRKILIGDSPSVEEIFHASSYRHITPSTPRAFIVHAIDDEGVPILNSRWYANALRREGVDCELIELDAGGHGFGMGESWENPPDWPKRCADWLRRSL